MVRFGLLVSVPLIVQAFGDPGMVLFGGAKVTRLGGPLVQGAAVIVPEQLPAIELAAMPVTVIVGPEPGVTVHGKPDGTTSQPHCQLPGANEPPVMVAEVPLALTVPVRVTAQVTVVVWLRVRLPVRVKLEPAGEMVAAEAEPAKPAAASAAAARTEALFNMTSSSVFSFNPALGTVEYNL